MDAKSCPSEVVRAHRVCRGCCDGHGAAGFSSLPETVLQQLRLGAAAAVLLQCRRSPEHRDIAVDRHRGTSNRRPLFQCEKTPHHRQSMLRCDECRDRPFYLIPGEQDVQEEGFCGGLDDLQRGAGGRGDSGIKPAESQHAISCPNQAPCRQLCLHRLVRVRRKCGRLDPLPDGRMEELNRRRNCLARDPGDSRQKTQRRIRGEYSEQTLVLPHSEAARTTLSIGGCTRQSCSAPQCALCLADIRCHRFSMTAVVGSSCSPRFEAVPTVELTDPHTLTGPS